MGQRRVKGREGKRVGQGWNKKKEAGWTEVWVYFILPHPTSKEALAFFSTLLRLSASKLETKYI